MLNTVHLEPLLGPSAHHLLAMACLSRGLSRPSLPLDQASEPISKFVHATKRLWKLKPLTKVTSFGLLPHAIFIFSLHSEVLAMADSRNNAVSGLYT